MLRLFRTTYRSIVGREIIRAAALRGGTSLVLCLVKSLSPEGAILVSRLRTTKEEMNAFQLQIKISAVSEKLGKENSLQAVVVGIAMKSLLSLTSQGIPTGGFDSIKNALRAATASLDSDPKLRLLEAPALLATSSLCETLSSNFSTGVPEGQASWQVPPLWLCSRSMIANCLGLAFRSTLTFAANPGDWKRES